MELLADGTLIAPSPDDAELAGWAKALGHPARIQILRILARAQTCHCGEIVQEVPLAQSTVSQHLRVLKDAGLIEGETDGPRSCYCLNAATLRRVRAGLDGLLGTSGDAAGCCR